MKNYFILMIVAATLSFSSCDNDDNNDDNANQLAGVYRIASWNAPVAQDFNNDGTSSTDLTTEYNCYANWEIDLNSDYTFTRTFNSVSVAEGLLNCVTDLTATGTWSRNGNTLVLTNSIGEIENTTTYGISGNNEILTLTGPGEFPTIFEEIFIMESGSVTIVYTKDN